MERTLFCWPSRLYDPEAGLSRSTLELVPACDDLWRHATDFGGWPGGLDGRIQFHALVLYCLRVGRPPGRLLTSAVRESKFGRLGWWTPADKVAAAKLLGISSCRRQSPVATAADPRPAIARDWTSIDAEIDGLADEAALELLPTQFARDLFQHAIVSGKQPKRVPTLRDVLRRAMVSRPTATSGRK